MKSYIVVRVHFFLSLLNFDILFCLLMRLQVHCGVNLYFLLLILVHSIQCVKKSKCLMMNNIHAHEQTILSYFSMQVSYQLWYSYSHLLFTFFIVLVIFYAILFEILIMKIHLLFDIEFQKKIEYNMWRIIWSFSYYNVFSMMLLATKWGHFALVCYMKLVISCTWFNLQCSNFSFWLVSWCALWT